MALSGEKIGVPSAEEAPIVVLPRYKQPIAGVLSIYDGITHYHFMKWK
ncbi:MAG: hypothetical protein ACTSRH_15090 [Promethearchaeota archaeon]